VGDVASVLGWACAWWGVALYWFAGLLYVRQAWTLVGRRGGADAGEPRTVAV
jgi:cardiolipin synthase